MSPPFFSFSVLPFSFQFSLDPVIVHKPVSGTRQTYLQFSRNSDIILVGDALGEVSVYLPKNLPPRPRNKVSTIFYTCRYNSYKILSIFLD